MRGNEPQSIVPHSRGLFLSFPIFCTGGLLYFCCELNFLLLSCLSACFHGSVAAQNNGGCSSLVAEVSVQFQVQLQAGGSREAEEHCKYKL